MPGKNILVLIISAAVISFIVIIGIYYSQNSKKPEPALPKTVSIPSPTPTPVSKPAPVTINTVTGTITALSSSSLTIDAGGKLQVFSISGTKDFQKITSGTIEAGDAKTAPSSASELKVGQKVFIIYNIGSTAAKSIYIIK